MTFKIFFRIVPICKSKITPKPSTEIILTIAVPSLPTNDKVSFPPLYLSFGSHYSIWCDLPSLQVLLLCSFNWQVFPEDLCSWRPPQLPISPTIFLELLQSTQIPCEYLVLHNKTMTENRLEFQYCSSLLCLPFKKIPVKLSPAKIIGQERLGSPQWQYSLLLFFSLILVTHLPELQQLALWQGLEQQLEHSLAGRWVAGGNTRKHQYQRCKWHISLLLRTNAAIHQLLWDGIQKWDQRLTTSTIITGITMASVWLLRLEIKPPSSCKWSSTLPHNFLMSKLSCA